MIKAAVAACLLVLTSLPRLGAADQPEPRQTSGSAQGFSLTPVDGSAAVVIHHSAFPGRSWRLQIPEHAYIEPDSKRTIVPSRIVWERLAEGTLRYRWDAPAADKQRWRLDYWCLLRPGPDYIDFELTGRNVGDKAWGELPWAGCLRLVCLQAGKNPDFHDYEAQRTFVRLQGRWVTMNQVVGGHFEAHRMASVPMEKNGKPFAERLAARVSRDGQWVVGIATDIAGNVSFNFQTRIACMHSNPYWPKLKPGETATARGRIYLLRGGLENLWARYRQDFYDEQGREKTLPPLAAPRVADRTATTPSQAAQAGKPQPASPASTLTAAKSPASPDAAKQVNVRLGRFIVVTNRAVSAVSACNASGVWEKLAKLSPLGTRQRFALPRQKGFMDKLGNTRLRVEPAAQVDAGVYLLADYETWPADAETTAWLRAHALAYHEAPRTSQDGEIILGLTSQSVTVRQKGAAIENVCLNGEDFLAPAAPVLPVARGKPCRMVKRDGNVWLYEDHWNNPLRVKVTPLGDRLRFNCVYQVVHPVDDYNDLRIVFHPARKVQVVESLGYDVGYSDNFRQESPGKDELMVNLSRTPFALARLDNGAYLGVLDTFQNNIYFYVSPAGQPPAVSVAYWAWPRIKGTVYRWEFELLVGYETYANALLRSAYPYTKDNHSQETAKGPFTYRAHRWPERAGQYSIAVHYYPGGGEYHRAGLYFDSEQDFDTLYDTPWSTIKKDYRRSYRMWQDEFAAMRAAGIEPYFYILLGRVSEDVASRFDSSLARDIRGNPMVVGKDGTLENLWVNMNPDLPFGSELLRQIDQALDVFQPAGIGLDRCDSNDDRQGDGYFDLGHFDGSASACLIDGKHRPGSSMTLQNKRWILSLRKLLDRHQAKLFANIPESLLHFRVCDLYKCDSFLDPWDLFFFRALGNGKPFYYQEQPIKRNLSQKDDFVSRLVQAYGRAEPDEMHATGYRIHKENRPLSRLLYIIPTDDRNPRFWVFADGATEMNYGRLWSREAYARYWSSKVYDNAGRQLPLPQKDGLAPPVEPKRFAMTPGSPRPRNPVHQSGENLLINGGMELERPSTANLQCAPGWKLVNLSGKSGEQARLVTDVSEGRTAQYIRAFDHLKGIVQSVRRYQPNTVYVLSFRAKVFSGKMAAIWALNDAEGNRVEKQLTVDAAKNGGRWQTYTLTAKNGNSAEGRALYFTTWRGPAEFLVDDVVLRKSADQRLSACPPELSPQKEPTKRDARILVGRTCRVRLLTKRERDETERISVGRICRMRLAATIVTPGRCHPPRDGRRPREGK